jgi:hypothetical protein
MKEHEPIYWWYAAWKILGAVVIVVGGAIPTVILGWDTMLPSGKFVAVVGLGVAAWKAVDAEFKQVVKRISEGKPPVPLNGGNTEIIKKDQ